MHKTYQIQGSDERAQVDGPHDGGKAPSSVVHRGLVVAMGRLCRRYMLSFERAIDRLFLAAISRLGVSGVSAGGRVCGHDHYTTRLGRIRTDWDCFEWSKSEEKRENVVLHPHIFFQTLYRAPGGGIAILGGAFKHYTEDDATVEL
jgi:hypothetical protein